MNPQPTWQELETYYNSNYGPYDPMLETEAHDEEDVRRAELTGQLRHIQIPKGKRILDVGCGGGYFLRIAKKLGASEQGVEPNKYAAKVVQKQGLNVFCGTLEEFAAQKTPKPIFDIITASHVVEHLPNPIETLQTMKRLLAPDGLIWTAVPNAAYPLGRAIKGRLRSADLPYHLMQFSPASMAKAGERAGLKVRQQTTESIPKIVESSLGEYFRYRWLLPRRLTGKTGLLPPISRWYAQKIDEKTNGEAIFTEFIH